MISPATLRALHYEALYPFAPEVVGLGAENGRHREASEEIDGVDVSVFLLREDGGILFVASLSTAWAAATVVQKLEDLATEVLGDLGVNEAAQGTLRPVRRLLVDTCGYSDWMQRPVIEHQHSDGPRPDGDGKVGV